MFDKCLLVHSFYNRSLPQNYVLNGKGLGFLSLFALAFFTAFVFAVKLSFFAMDVTPEQIKDFTKNVPEIKIVDGTIVEPENFFQRIQLPNGLNVTLDTTQNDLASQDVPSVGEIYISQNTIHFINGNRVELFPLSRFLNENNLTLNKEKLHTFIHDLLKDMTFVIPLTVFIIVLPMMFFKYVFLTYGLALLTYIITLYPRLPLAFEERMRLAVISCLPVFIINLIFGSALSWFTLGTAGSVLIAFAYLYYYLSQLSQKTI